MNKKLSILISTAIAAALLAIGAQSWITAASAQKKSAGDATQSLQDRVSRLEKQITDLQAQIKELSRKSSSKILALPGTQTFPENKMPPGATQREINGLKYWIIPISDDH